MATNRVYAEGRFLYLEVPEGTESGDPVVVGDIPGVALTDRDSEDKATIDTSGAYKLTVNAKEYDTDAYANKAVSIGDIVYHDEDNPDEGDLNVAEDADNAVRFGYALEAVNAGEEEEILVKIGY